MPFRPASNASIRYALLEIAGHLIVARRWYVGDWPSSHKQDEYEQQMIIEEDLRSASEDAGLVEPSSFKLIIH